MNSTNPPIPGLTYYVAGGAAQVFPTGIPGIGYVISIADPLQMVYSPGNYPESQVLPDQPAVPTYGFLINVTYVITGPVAAGTYSLPSQTFAELVVKQNGNGPDYSSRVPIISPGLQFTVNASSCSVQNSSVSVNLPRAQVSALSAPGSTAGGTPFQINLNCDPNVMVYATMTDATDPGNASDLLTLTSSSAAQGVALRIFRDDALTTAVSYGPDSSAPGTENQWLVGNSGAGGGSLQIPLTVSYVRTSGTLTAGSVNAKATITMSYQ
jgi:type 1 fimbria pilin